MRGTQRAQVSHTTYNQENNDFKVAVLNVKPIKLYTCSMCEKDFKSEKGLKCHMIFKHTSNTKNHVQSVFVIELLIDSKTVY